MTTHSMTLRLDDDDKAAVVELASTLHVNQQEVIRVAVRALRDATGRRQRVLESIQRTAVENEVPLRRLGEA